MPAITTEFYAYVGARNAIVYAKNVYGRIAGTGATAYTGIEVTGLKGLNLTIAPARRIAHQGNDGITKTQTLPAVEVSSGEINVDGSDLPLLAALMGSTIISPANIQMLPHLSDLQGSEPNVGIILYQAAVAISGAQRWRDTFITNCKAIPRIPGAGPEPIDTVWDLTPDPVDQYLWGMGLSELSDPSDPYSGVSASGAFSAGIWDGFSAFRPRIASFIAQAGQVLFSFPANLQAANVTDIAVFTANGTGTPVEQDAADYTATTAGVTFDTAPVTTYGEGTEVNILYQIAD